ncbi:MAG: hypothetical protein R3246_04715 [Acidimicrobiia bacterium]|nr:hypothetical protein [Acidimicrobiia bacterium]
MGTDSVRTAPDVADGLLGARFRWIAVRALAAAIAGVVVLGIGGRLVMLASRLLHPDAVGRFTEGGNLIGKFTLGGTVALVLFGGLGSGLIAGVVWVFIREWIPDNSWLVGFGAMLIGGFALVEADNRDFVILGDPLVDVVMLLALVFTFGVTVLRLDRWLDRRLPSGNTGWTVGYAAISLVGVPLLIPAFGNFFSRDFCFCHSPPIWTGVFLSVAAAASVTWWVLDFRQVSAVSRVLPRLGQLAVVGAVIAGGVHLTAQIVAIL